MVLGLIIYINWPDSADGGRVAQAEIADLPTVSLPKWGERILLLSPHPDDETLCCAGYLQRAQERGAKVYIAWVTAGDGFEVDSAVTEGLPGLSHAGMRQLALRRQQEARAAAAILGVPKANLTFLGYPDGGLTALNTLNFTEPYTSPHTGAKAVYLPDAQTPGAPFTGEALTADLRQLLDRVQPDTVLIPAPQDHHGDHHTLSYFVMRLMAQRGEEERLRYWIVHGGLEWPLPKGYHPKLPLMPPPLGRHLPWRRFDLTLDEQDTKRRAIAAYRTQTEVLGRFMWAFDRRNELLSPSPVPQPGAHKAVHKAD